MENIDEDDRTPDFQTEILPFGKAIVIKITDFNKRIFLQYFLWRLQELMDISREIAFNLALIYRHSGSEDLALRVYHKYLRF